MTANSDIIETPKLQRIKEKLDLMVYDELADIAKSLTENELKAIIDFIRKSKAAQKGTRIK